METSDGARHGLTRPSGHTRMYIFLAGPSLVSSPQFTIRWIYSISSTIVESFFVISAFRGTHLSGDGFRLTTTSSLRFADQNGACRDFRMYHPLYVLFQRVNAMNSSWLYLCFVTAMSMTKDDRSQLGAPSRRMDLR